VSHILAELVAPLDALLLRGDGDPTTRAIMTAALVLEHPPDEARLSEAFERASRSVPRMRQRVVRPDRGLGHARWADDDLFDVTDHVRRVGAPGDGSVDSVLAMAAEFATAPFDPARPLWEAIVVTGVVGSVAVVVLRVHHAIADGVRAIHMLANLLDLEADPSRGEMPPLEARGPWLQAAREHVVQTTSKAISTSQRRASSTVRIVLESAWRPLEAVTSAAAYANSALRTYGREGAEPSPLLGARSRARRFAVLRFTLAELRAVAKANEATINDVFVTGLLGGLRAYHQALGAHVADVPVSLPIDVGSGRASDTGGNHFSAVVIPGPCSEPDPVARLREVHRLMQSRRSEQAVDAPLRLAPLLEQTPHWLTRPAVSAYARRVDLQASNIVGPDIPLYLAGAKVADFYAFGPLPGVPIMAVLASYQGACTIGFTIDPAAVTDLPTFLACTHDSFLELIGGA
jgi:diacylglycerol O-acyltransferase / wax synthase